MKRIVKGPPPTELIAWTVVNRHTPNFNYGALPGHVQVAVKQALLQEQGWLCCYTGHSLTDESSHIEHFKPQHIAPDEDVDYVNLHAAHPRDGGDAALGYGAPFKAGWYDPLLVSPLSPNCEPRFRYDLSGEVHPTNADDAGVALTIEKLGLWQQALVSRRRAAIENLTRPIGRPSLRLAELRRLLDELDRRDGAGRYRQFCFVVRQAAVELLKRAERHARGRAFARRELPR